MQIPGLSVAPSGLEALGSLAWRRTRSPGVEWIDLGTTEDGSKTVLIRMAPGHGYPAHRHIGPEDVLVLSGGYRDEDGAVHTTGAFVRYPSGSVHAPVALRGDELAGSGDAEPRPAPACVLFAVAHRGTTVLDDAERA